MKSGPLTFTIIAVALTLFGCVPPTSRPSPPPLQTGGAPAPQTTGSFCDANNTDPFLNHVYFLTSPVDPVYPYTQKLPVGPSLSSANAASAVNIQQDLIAAFTIAPPTFQQQLCSLDGIYINPTGCTNPEDPSTCNVGSNLQLLDSSWGYRTISSNPQRYIATSLALWKNGHAPFFVDFETARLQALLQRAAQYNNNPPPISYPFSFGLVSPNTSALTVLAALAHEFGHVLWYDKFVVDENGNPNPGGAANTGLFCLDRGTFYPSGSWVNNVTVPIDRWLGFGDRQNDHANNDVDLSQLVADLGQGNFQHVGDLLHGLYSGNLPNGYSRPDNGPWASPLAAFSPIEDFVETYQFYILKSATQGQSLQNLQIVISGKRNYTDDIAITWRNKTELRRKMKCIDPNLPP